MSQVSQSPLEKKILQLSKKEMKPQQLLFYVFDSSGSYLQKNRKLNFLRFTNCCRVTVRVMKIAVYNSSFSEAFTIIIRNNNSMGSFFKKSSFYGSPLVNHHPSCFQKKNLTRRTTLYS